MIARHKGVHYLLFELVVRQVSGQLVKANLNFIIQQQGWFGPKDKLGAPLLFNLRRDPYEKAAEESLMYGEWLGKKMWAFGPTRRLVQRHLATFQEFPPRRPSAGSNAEEMLEEASGEQGLAQ